ncbi:Tryptophan synthase beta chain [Candidatus Lokiarchaeum ossiferum]|uniref:Tryptophan synthase beta chain n=1 Tax=Candidatus Lokiarchaeum ossiferum TaxID=2951803 RepID=A0ABY6HYC8_9ARCH|nr:Tryptophan synthase beta chain [Candidatus Lokiarchaeum sp. B-35]
MISYSKIQEAYDRISKEINHTPVMTSRTLNSLLDAQIYLKCENFQRIGAFKFRGAYNAISQLSDEQKSRGVITHSSGNHAQAVALTAKILGINATIVMPKGSPQVKINATRDTYGAKVVLCENTVKSRHETCDNIMTKEGQTLIHPYDNDHIIAGAGTAAFELLQEVPNLDMIIAPVGGGGLLSGSSIAAKGINSHIRVIAAEPEGADDAYRSLLSGKIESNQNPNTIADGLRTNLCNRTFSIIRTNVEKIITVSESEIIHAMQLIWERMKIIIEPSSATPLAALLSKKISVKNLKVGLIISGGNIDLTDFFSLLKKQIV